MSKITQFTWEELSSLNEEHNAHVAVRGKVIYSGIFHVLTFVILPQSAVRSCDLFVSFRLGVRCQ